MSQVVCKVERMALMNKGGKKIASLRVRCPKCGRCAEAFGQRGRSLKRCLDRLKDKCPSGAKNEYTTKENNGNKIADNS